MKDNKLFLILEYMSGGDLAQLLALKKRLSEPVARQIFYQVAAGVNYMHNQQIVHRDIKVFLTLITTYVNLLLSLLNIFLTLMHVFQIFSH